MSCACSRSDCCESATTCAARRNGCATNSVFQAAIANRCRNERRLKCLSLETGGDRWDCFLFLTDPHTPPWRNLICLWESSGTTYLLTHQALNSSGQPCNENGGRPLDPAWTVCRGRIPVRPSGSAAPRQITGRHTPARVRQITKLIDLLALEAVHGACCDVQFRDRDIPPARCVTGDRLLERQRLIAPRRLRELGSQN